MSQASIPAIRESDFSASARVDGAKVETTLTGNADLNVKSQLDGFLLSLHQHALGDSVSEVVVDVRNLEFINSSCLKAFVTWISSVQAQPINGQYRIVFLSSPRLHWQRRSLHALSCFANDLVSIQT